MIAFTIPGKAQPKERPRVGKNGHIFTPRTTEKYERWVADCYRSAAGLRGFGEGVACSVTLRIFWPDRRRRDLDNGVKSVLDGLNGVAFADDSQVAELHVFRGLDRARPRVEVELRALRVVP